VCGPQPLRCQDCGRQLNGQIESARDVAIDHKVIMTSDQLGGRCGRHRVHWNSEGKPFDSKPRRLESRLVLLVNLNVSFPSMALGLQL